MKVLVIGDSYGLPRFAINCKEVELSYEETYPELLRQLLARNYQEDILLVNRCRHANTTCSLSRGDSDEVFFLHPEYVVVQLGLVDLWPSSLRNVQPLQKELEGKDPWVNEEEYQVQLIRFIRFVLKSGGKVIVVNIPKIHDGILRRHPLVAARITKYNFLLRKICETISGVALVDLYGIIDKSGDEIFLGSDGIHPTLSGTTELAMNIFDKINKLQ